MSIGNLEFGDLELTSKYFSFEYERQIFIVNGNGKSEATFLSSEKYHRTIPNSEVPIKCGIYTIHVRIGNFIWFLGGGTGNFNPDRSKSILWSLKRQKWIKGPDLPQKPSNDIYGTLQTVDVTGGCALAINRSNVIIFGKYYQGISPILIYSNYDFKSQKWSHSEPGEISFAAFKVTCEVNFSKDSVLLIYILFEMEGGINFKIFNPMDLSWQTKSFPFEHKIGKLVSSKGTLHYFYKSTSGLNHLKLQQDWEHIQTMSNVSLSEINNIISYIQSYCPDKNICI